jgi:tetratricopeptide (TPR) repeat protein
VRIRETIRQAINGLPADDAVAVLSHLAKEHENDEEGSGYLWQTLTYEASGPLTDRMVDRNLQGQAMEKEGRYTEAIALYEANISDRFNGSHPYERLARIYYEAGRVEDFHRVCEAAFIRGAVAAPSTSRLAAQSG